MCVSYRLVIRISLSRPFINTFVESEVALVPMARPIVGCEGRRHSRARTERDGCREEAEARDGLGEAVRRWSPPKRRSNCRPRPVKCNDHNIILFFSFLQQDTSHALSCEHYTANALPFLCREFLFVLYSDNKYAELWSVTSIWVEHVECI